MLGFGVGALSTLIASWASLGLMLDAVPVLLPFTLDNATVVMVLMAVIVAPFVEELAKPIGLYLMNSEEKMEINLRDWAVLGACAGFGFAVVENFLYAASVYGYGSGVSAWLLVLRFLMPLHVVATAISGFGFGLWAKTGKAKYFAGCIFVSMLLHGLFNLAATVVG
jgi:RsiW-degrading membrane proteinase PrsW (M82 family)